MYILMVNFHGLFQGAPGVHTSRSGSKVVYTQQYMYIIVVVANKHPFSYFQRSGSRETFIVTATNSPPTASAPCFGQFCGLWGHQRNYVPYPFLDSAYSYISAFFLGRCGSLSVHAA